MNPAAVRIVHELDVDSLPTGQLSRLRVDLVEDGLGHAIRAPVLVVRGAKPGPTFGITAALHGNELNGVPVVQRLINGLDPAKLRGTVVGVVVANVPGVLLHQREFADGRDLNHIMPGKPDGNRSEVYAHRLVHRIVRHFDYLVDLHTASFGRFNSLYVRADLLHPQTSAMARLLRPQIALHNPASDRTLRGTAMEMGIPAVTLEIGNPQRFQQRYIQASLVGIRSVLARYGLVAKRRVALGPLPVVCRQSAWMYTSTGGFLEVLPEVAAAVKAGEQVARLRDVFGDIQEEYFAPHDGVVIGRSVDPVGEAGARIIHLGLPADGTEGFMPQDAEDGFDADREGAV